MGTGGSLGSTRYSTPPDPPSYRTPGTPTSAWGLAATLLHGHVPDLNMAVGLISVQQLTLSAHFSENRTITEVYNLAVAGNPDDHNHIPGLK